MRPRARWQCCENAHTCVAARRPELVSSLKRDGARRRAVTARLENPNVSLTQHDAAILCTPAPRPISRSFLDSFVAPSNSAARPPSLSVRTSTPLPIAGSPGQGGRITCRAHQRARLNGTFRRVGSPNTCPRGMATHTYDLSRAMRRPVMNTLPSVRNAILRAMDADGAPQRLAMEIVSQPRDQRDGLIRRLRILYCEGIARSGQSRQTVGMLGDVLEARLREQVADIEARGGGTVGTA